MKNGKKSETKSLRTMVMMWLLMFSVVPLAFITGYSLVKFEQAIDQELIQRLIANQRELGIIFREFESEISTQNLNHSSDKTLAYYLSSNSIATAKELAERWMANPLLQQMSIFNRERRLEISLTKDSDGNIKRQQALEGSVVLDNAFVQTATEEKQSLVAEFTKDKLLDLAAFSPVFASNGSIVGYIDEVLRIDRSFLVNLKNRLNLEVAFISGDGSKAVASHQDLESYKSDFFIKKAEGQRGSLFDLSIRGEPYGFMVREASWGNTKFYVAVGASKRAAASVLKTVNVAFFTVVGAVVLLLIVLSFIISKSMLRPLKEVIDAIQNADLDAEQPINVPSTSDTELGILTSSFNEMFKRVYMSQRQLKDNIKKLEEANLEIRDTQAKLVHTAKMASLGQLVAGVAHELNNPISFIYSNVTHLRDYGDRLIHLVKTADSDPSKLQSEKSRLEFDYVTSDLPKLIKSCEEGARRTRDIVAGLRNFSRLDESKLKEVDIHEGIESTLALLSSEMKDRIQIKKNFSSLPKVTCYPSQLNQVFMNILSNAIQAISESGTITIETKSIVGQKVQVSIKDTGIGMSEDVAQKIFDPFFTTKDVNQGTGLGMSIAYGVIQKHGGEITVSSKKGQGTEFIITLPVHAG